MGNNFACYKKEKPSHFPQNLRINHSKFHDDVLVEVFRYLTIKEKCRARYVCKRWMFTVDYILDNQMALSCSRDMERKCDHDIEIGDYIGDKLICNQSTLPAESIFRRFPNLRCLSINLDQMNHQYFNFLNEHCSRLECLKINCCSTNAFADFVKDFELIDEKFAERIKSFSVGLKERIMVGITEDLMLKIVSKMTILKQLDFSRITPGIDDTFEYLNEFPKKLKILTLSCNNYSSGLMLVTTLIDGSIKYQLERFYLIIYKQLDEEEEVNDGYFNLLQIICENFSNLKSFKLKLVVLISDENVHEIPDENLIVPDILFKLSKLERLSLCGLKSTHLILPKYVSPPMKEEDKEKDASKEENAAENSQPKPTISTTSNLKELKINLCSLNYQTFSQVYIQYPNVKLLELSNNEFECYCAFADEADGRACRICYTNVWKAISFMPQLEQLYVNDLHEIVFASLLFEQLIKIKSLKLISFVAFKSTWMTSMFDKEKEYLSKGVSKVDIEVLDKAQLIEWIIDCFTSELIKYLMKTSRVKVIIHGMSPIRFSRDVVRAKNRLGVDLPHHFWTNLTVIKRLKEIEP